MIENMTNEQAAECLKTIHVLSFKDETATFFLTDVQNAFKLAIKALEQQPCEDCISRADILDAIETWDKFGINAEQKLIRWQDHYVPYVHLDDVRHAIANMPSVTPSYNSINTELKPCGDCISREAVKKLKKYSLSYDTNTTIPKADIFVKIADIKRLPSVTPKQKVGKWIDTGIGKEELYGEMFVCSECDSISYYENYCPNCGAKMAESEE